MTNNCSINGVPRTIHTTVRLSQRNGKKRLIEPNAMIRPSGNAPISVIANSFKDCTKPSFKELMTRRNCSKTIPPYRPTKAEGDKRPLPFVYEITAE